MLFSARRKMQARTIHIGRRHPPPAEVIAVANFHRLSGVHVVPGTQPIVTQATLLAVETLESLKKRPGRRPRPETYSDPNNLSMNGQQRRHFQPSWVIDDPSVTTPRDVFG